MENTLGLTFKETMSGHFALGATDPRAGAAAGSSADQTLAMHAEVIIGNLDEFIANPMHLGKLQGSIDFAPLGENLASHSGVFNLFKPTDDVDTTRMIYELGFSANGQDYYLAGYKEVRDDVGFDLWSDTTTLFTTLHKGKDKTGEVVGAGVLTLGVTDLAKLLSTMRVLNAENTAQKTQALSRFGQFFMGELWDSYAVSKFSGAREDGNNNEAEEFDAVVIGSGFGGAVMAARLAEKGMSVCVLERGREWTPETYPRNPGDAWWWDEDKPAKKNGWIDLRFFDDMATAAGCGVGGGSLIYANIFVEAEPFSFEEGWPKEISYDGLTPYYQRTGEMLNVQPIPDNQMTARGKLMKEAADKIGEGHRYRKLPLAVTFNKDWNYDLPDPFNESHSVTHTNAQGMQQGTCVHCGNCDIGCTVQAKNTLDLNYLPVAKRNGAQIRPLHWVRRITPEDNGYEIDFDRIDVKNEKLISGHVRAKKVFVAAGSVGSTELLLRCRDEYGSLPNISDRLGYGWSSNGDFLTPAFYEGRDMAPTRGPTISSAIDFLDGSFKNERFFVEDGGFPDVLGNAIQDMGDDIVRYGTLAAALGQMVRDRNPLSCVMPWFGQGVDAPDGRFSLKRSWLPPFKKKLDLDWDVTRSEGAVQALIDMHKKLSAATGGEPMVPATWTVLKNLVTPHPLGGCCMGNNAGDGVVDHKGEVFGYPGLYVVDGAIFPKPVGLNPSRTIAALAERIADFVEVPRGGKQSAAQPRVEEVGA